MDSDSEKPKSPWTNVVEGIGCLLFVVAVILVSLVVSVWHPLVAAITRWLQ